MLYPYDYGARDNNSKWIIAKGTSDWTYYTTEFTTGENTSNSRINFKLKNAGGIAWFDDITLTAVH